MCVHASVVLLPCVVLTSGGLKSMYSYEHKEMASSALIVTSHMHQD